ncbi:hypothetical protein H6F96_07565 [Microcoleus sp. FACHB-53]|nr:hypothetical protein [Microcoleus sp. FACHB-53]MBD2127645.1 hypothetical protein [Microcoleus sp. FACHB-1]
MTQPIPGVIGGAIALQRGWNHYCQVNLSPSPFPPLPNPLRQREGKGFNLLPTGESGSLFPGMMPALTKGTARAACPQNY